MPSQHSMVTCMHTHARAYMLQATQFFISHHSMLRLISHGYKELWAPQGQVIGLLSLFKTVLLSIPTSLLLVSFYEGETVVGIYFDASHSSTFHLMPHILASGQDSRRSSAVTHTQCNTLPYPRGMWGCVSTCRPSLPQSSRYNGTNHTLLLVGGWREMGEWMGRR